MAVLALIALRLTIGMHFFGEGYKKTIDPKPYSGAFFGNAKGPLAPLYKGRVWDLDGKRRLNFSVDEEGRSVVDVDLTLDQWEAYKTRLETQYQFDADRKKQAQAILGRYEQQLRWYFDENDEEIREYFLGLERRDRNNDDLTRSEVASLRGQAEQIEAELRSKRAPWLATVDSMWDGYEREMSQLATGSANHRVELVPRGRHWLDSESIDQFIPYFDMVIGVLLIIGLFTPVAAWVGALFLLSVIVSQWPGAPGSMPVWPQAIEMFALIVLGAVGAGRFAGLDSIIRALWYRCCKAPSQEK